MDLQEKCQVCRVWKKEPVLNERHSTEVNV